MFLGSWDCVAHCCRLDHHHQDFRSDPQYVEIIAESCRESGYKIEYGQKDVRLQTPLREDDLRILDADSDFTYFAEYLYNKSLVFLLLSSLLVLISDLFFFSTGKYSHFWGDSEEHGPIIVTIEKDKSKKFQKALIRTSKVRLSSFLILIQNTNLKLKASQKQTTKQTNRKMIVS